MRATRVAGQALTLAAEPARSYICQSCRAQATRHFSSATPTLADRPFWQRMSDSIFGSKPDEKAQRLEKKLKETTEQIAKGERAQPADLRVSNTGAKFRVAEVVDENIHKDYVPASTWQGLDRVGGEQWTTKRLDRGEQYEGFLPQRQKQLRNDQWEKLVHHVAVEALVLQKAGRSPLQICNPRKNSAIDWTKSAVVAVFQDEASLEFADGKGEQAILDAIPVKDVVSRDSAQESILRELKATTAPGVELAYPKDKTSWMNMRLQHPDLKLAVLKRIMQLTGKRISDPAISHAEILRDVYDAFKVKEKPNKLWKTDELKKMNKQVANVQVHTSRQTPVHKEKEIGRWKVIEDELILRDLPVFGDKYKNAKELDNYR